MRNEERSSRWNDRILKGRHGRLWQDSSNRNSSRGDGDGREEMAQAHARRPDALARDTDDGLRLRPDALRRIAEAAAVPDLDVRVSLGAGRQEFLCGDAGP